MKSKPGFYLAVVGGETCPRGYVHSKLDALTERILTTHRVVLVSRGGAKLSEWASEKHVYGVSVQLEPLDWQLYGRNAEPRWAMRICGMASGIVIFGPESKWWRLLRYAKEADMPVRIYKKPRVEQLLRTAMCQN